ncbi:conserved hypothetical protein [Vibrio phage 277E43-1]|nr:conserved hypothetical protein [Vibrio phage 277E43-1]
MHFYWILMNIIIPTSILSFIDTARCKLSRPVYIIKCVAYIKCKGITLNGIETTITQNYESKHKNDRTDQTNQEGKN